MAEITRHAAKRIRERQGIPKRASQKTADKALAEGLTYEDTSGSLRRFISALYLKRGTANNIRIYCDQVYIFHDETLITVFPLPQKYRRTVREIRRKGR